MQILTNMMNLALIFSMGIQELHKKDFCILGQRIKILSFSLSILELKLFLDTIVLIVWVAHIFIRDNFVFLSALMVMFIS